MLLLTLGSLLLLRSTRGTRRLLRQMPVPESEWETCSIPTRLTRVKVPLRLRRETALSLRRCLEDQVILLEMVAARMRTLASMISDSLRRR